MKFKIGQSVLVTPKQSLPPCMIGADATGNRVGVITGIGEAHDKRDESTWLVRFDADTEFYFFENELEPKP